jgi:hypothetical protein
LRQITLVQIRLAEDGPFQSRPFQIGPGEFRVAQVCLAQIRALIFRLFTVFEPLSMRFHDRLQLLGRNGLLSVRALTSGGVTACLTRLCCMGDGRYADGHHRDQHSVDGTDSGIGSVHFVSP